MVDFQFLSELNASLTYSSQQFYVEGALCSDTLALFSQIMEEGMEFGKGVESLSFSSSINPLSFSFSIPITNRGVIRDTSSTFLSPPGDRSTPLQVQTNITLNPQATDLLLVLPPPPLHLSLIHHLSHISLWEGPLLTVPDTHLSPSSSVILTIPPFTTSISLHQVYSPLLLPVHLIPPDASRGLMLSPPSLCPNTFQTGCEQAAGGMLVPITLVDQSMPYNVAALLSSLLSLLVGSAVNAWVRIRTRKV